MMTISAEKMIGVHTGQTCPQDGVWQATVKLSTAAQIAKGEEMPVFNGVSVLWKLIR